VCALQFCMPRLHIGLQMGHQRAYGVKMFTTWNLIPSGYLCARNDGFSSTYLDSTDQFVVDACPQE
jgi:hypothetical protein